MQAGDDENGADAPTTTLGAVPWIREAPGQRTTLLWSPGLRDEVAAAATAEYPREACGLLLGRAFPSGACVMRIGQARNSHPTSPTTRFELAPEDFFRLDAEAREAGLEIVGVWHSHPDRPARPSRTDAQTALESYAHVIASVTRLGVLDVRSWRLDEGRVFVEEALLEQPS